LGWNLLSNWIRLRTDRGLSDKTICHQRNERLAQIWYLLGEFMMRDWKWTPRARRIGELLTAAGIIATGWVLFVGTWFMLGGN
jgi:hypothetical protein